MRTFVNAQGSVAIIRPLKNGKVRLRIRDCKGVTFVSELCECEDDAGVVMNMHGEIWVEKNI